uniref:Uncharacterized protein n=1 Tax=Meloidogyne enterolobii TaxID=390850 RepID=A0A6V7TSZ5_MELEN|nr:unnamed protein product [Meloidogyne enterolobii]
MHLYYFLLLFFICSIILNSIEAPKIKSKKAKTSQDDNANVQGKEYAFNQLNWFIDKSYRLISVVLNNKIDKEIEYSIKFSIFEFQEKYDYFIKIIESKKGMILPIYMNRNIYTPEYLKNIAKIMEIKENGVISMKKLPPFMVLDKKMQHLTQALRNAISNTCGIYLNNQIKYTLCVFSHLYIFTSMIQTFLFDFEPYKVHINVNLTIYTLKKWFDMGPGGRISNNIHLSAIRQQFYTEWMCDAGSKMLDYLKVETNKKECTDRIESGYKDLAKIFVKSVSMDYSEDNIVEELSKLKLDNAEYK